MISAKIRPEVRVPPPFLWKQSVVAILEGRRIYTKVIVEIERAILIVLVAPDTLSCLTDRGGKRAQRGLSFLEATASVQDPLPLLGEVSGSYKLEKR